MQVTLLIGHSVADVLAEPVPDVEWLYVLPDATAAARQTVSRGGGRYVPAEVLGVYRDPTRTFDAVCVIATPEGSGVPRCVRVTVHERDDDGLDGDLRIPLAGIRDAVIDAAGTGRGPDLPPGSLAPGAVAFGPPGEGERRSHRPYYTIDERLLAEVAWVVGRAALDGASTREAVAETWGIAETTAAEWIARARDAGTLPEVHGKRSPSVEDNQPTDQALRTLGVERERINDGQ